MEQMPADLTEKMLTWPEAVAARAYEVRAHFLEQANDMGIAHLGESLKWGEPSWRPRKGGTTLRLSWSPGNAGILGLYVDCKTDLCARMQSDYPAAFDYAPPRVMRHDVGAPLPVDAIRHLARIAFRYKRVIPAR